MRNLSTVVNALPTHPRLSVSYHAFERLGTRSAVSHSYPARIIGAAPVLNNRRVTLDCVYWGAAGLVDVEWTVAWEGVTV